MTKKTVGLSISGKPEEGKIPIVWEIPDSVVTRWASNIIVQYIEKDYKISFFELKPQVYLGGPLPTEAKAVCVASVIVSAERLPKFIKALNDQLEKIKTMEKEDEDE